MSITHIIYDCDGLLLDTETLHVQVNSAIASRYDRTFTRDIHHAMIGRPAHQSMQILIDRLQLPLSVDQYMIERDRLITQLYPTSQPLPGAKELTFQLYCQSIPQAIATSSSAPRFQQKMSCHQEWLDLFDCVVTGDDPAIAQGKPAPDIFLLTAERLGALPHQCLVFEDSPAGVLAAKQAGMTAIVVPDPTMDRELFQLADQILPSLLDFDPAHYVSSVKSNCPLPRPLSHFGRGEKTQENR
ncbi:MAG: HAD-IA family hydrolase [Cyanothece sp. SIO2G6]|nr:HAD-IA family hydrolase [Cyanothece sp. SIO2G6]